MLCRIVEAAADVLYLPAGKGMNGRERIEPRENSGTLTRYSSVLTSYPRVRLLERGFVLGGERGVEKKNLVSMSTSEATMSFLSYLFSCTWLSLALRLARNSGVV